MDHSRFQMMIQQHIDKALAPAEEELLRQHLESCPDCAALLRDLTRLDRILTAELCEVEPPADFAAGVMAALPADSGKRTRSRSYLTWGAVAAAALLLAAAISGLFRPADTLAPPPVAVDDETAVPPELTLPNAPVTAEADPGESSAENSENNENNSENETAAPGKDDASSPETKPHSAEESAEPAPTYSGERELPAVASGSHAAGAYSTVTLASVANCDAVRPQVNGSVVTFYINLDGSYLQWQVSADGSGNAVFLGECDGLPALSGAGQYRSDESGREWYSASYGANQAENTDSGLRINGETVSSAGGGYLVSWAGDGSKVLFTDGGGDLYLYYPAEDTLLEVASSVSSAVWYGVNAIVTSAYDSATGYYSIFRVTVP